GGACGGLGSDLLVGVELGGGQRVGVALLAGGDLDGDLLVGVVLGLLQDAAATATADAVDGVDGGLQRGVGRHARGGLAVVAVGARGGLGGIAGGTRGGLGGVARGTRVGFVRHRGGAGRGLGGHLLVGVELGGGQRVGVALLAGGDLGVERGLLAIVAVVK